MTRRAVCIIPDPTKYSELIHQTVLLIGQAEGSWDCDLRETEAGLEISIAPLPVLRDQLARHPRRASAGGLDTQRPQGGPMPDGWDLIGTVDLTGGVTVDEVGSKVAEIFEQAVRDDLRRAAAEQPPAAPRLHLVDEHTTLNGTHAHVIEEIRKYLATATDTGVLEEALLAAVHELTGRSPRFIASTLRGMHARAEVVMWHHLRDDGSVEERWGLERPPQIDLHIIPNETAAEAGTDLGADDSTPRESSPATASGPLQPGPDAAPLFRPADWPPSADQLQGALAAEPPAPAPVLEPRLCPECDDHHLVAVTEIPPTADDAGDGSATVDDPPSSTGEDNGADPSVVPAPGDGGVRAAPGASEPDWPYSAQAAEIVHVLDRFGPCTILRLQDEIGVPASQLFDDIDEMVDGSEVAWIRSNAGDDQLVRLDFVGDPTRSQRILDVSNGLTACRSCGCTLNAACDGGCGWVEDDLCSACAPPAVPDPPVSHEPEQEAPVGGERSVEVLSVIDGLATVIVPYLATQPASWIQIWVYLNSEGVILEPVDLTRTLKHLQDTGKITTNGESYALVDDETDDVDELVVELDHDLDAERAALELVEAHVDQPAPEPDPDPPAERSGPQTDDEIVAAIAEHGPIGVGALTEKLSYTSPAALGHRLRKLKEAGRIESTNRHWTITGTTSTTAAAPGQHAPKVSDEQIIDWIRRHGPAQTPAIADALAINRQPLKRLEKLQSAGLIGRTDAGDWYFGTKPPTNTTDPLDVVGDDALVRIVTELSGPKGDPVELRKIHDQIPWEHRSRIDRHQLGERLDLLANAEKIGKERRGYVA